MLAYRAPTNISVARARVAQTAHPTRAPSVGQNRILFYGIRITPKTSPENNSSGIKNIGDQLFHCNKIFCVFVNRMSFHCVVCHNKRNKHYCLVCPNEYPTIDELVEHQRKRNHPGGHLAVVDGDLGRGARNRVLSKLVLNTCCRSLPGRRLWNVSSRSLASSTRHVDDLHLTIS